MLRVFHIAKDDVGKITAVDGIHTILIASSLIGSDLNQWYERMDPQPTGFNPPYLHPPYTHPLFSLLMSGIPAQNSDFSPHPRPSHPRPPPIFLSKVPPPLPRPLTPGPPSPLHPDTLQTIFSTAFPCTIMSGFLYAFYWGLLLEKIENEWESVRVMDWRRTGTMPLPKPMMTKFIDAIWCHYHK